MANKYLDELVPGVQEAAPSDGKEYVRKDGAWQENTSLLDAPQDGKEYIRKDGVWVENAAPASGITVETASFTAAPGVDYFVNGAAEVIVSIDAATIAIGERFSVFNSNSSSNNVQISSTNYDLVGDLMTVTGGDNLTLAGGEGVRLLCATASELQVIGM